MIGIYDVFRGEEKIGKAEVRREGLYYRFQCFCDLTGEVLYRLTVTCGDKTENLGIPVPDGVEFVLQKRLPVCRFPSGIPEFRAVPKHAPLAQDWVPISPEIPSHYIERLEQAVSRKQMLFISAAAPQDSDPNPEYHYE